jgi:hypothetical protein
MEHDARDCDSLTLLDERDSAAALSLCARSERVLGEAHGIM